MYIYINIYTSNTYTITHFYSPRHLERAFAWCFTHGYYGIFQLLDGPQFTRTTLLQMFKNVPHLLNTSLCVFLDNSLGLRHKNSEPFKTILNLERESSTMI